MAAVYDLLARRLMRGSLYHRLAAGVIFGLLALASMMTPLRFAPGIIYDGRSVILSVAGFIGGPAAGGVAAVIAGAYRIWLGGAGMAAGVCVILEAAGFGVLFHRLRLKGEGWERPERLFLLGLAVHLVQLALQLLLPEDIRWEAIRALAPVLLIVYPLAVVLIISLFLQGERKHRAEQALQASEERYRSLFDTSHAPMLLLDPRDDSIAEANTAACRYYGYRRDQLIGSRYADLSLQPENESASLFLDAQEQGRHSFELQHLRADGSVRTVIVFTSAVLEREREYLYLVIHDITRLREAEQQLHSLLEEKEVLLREINHRVKNNLAVLVGLLNLQLGEVHGREEALDALYKTRDRILAMSSIHNLLYHSSDVSRIPFAEYLRDVVTTLRGVYHGADGVRVEFELEDFTIDVNYAVPVGLIVNEAVTNAMKHAFDGQTADGVIRVRFYRNDGWDVLRVEDNGKGFGPGDADEKNPSLGMQLMQSLAQQIDGDFAMYGEGGTTVILRFPRKS